MKRVIRWSVKRAPKRRRHNALTGHEKTVLQRYHTLFLTFLALTIAESNRSLRRDMAIYAIKRERLRLVYITPLVPNPRKLFVIESFNESDSFRYLRFKKSLIRKLFTGLGVFKLQEWILLDDDNLYHREAVSY
jgi:hypothetical protein